MPSIFLEANIFFAAVRSSTGGSYFIIELAKKRKFPVITVAHVLAEAERNIGKKIGSEALTRHYENLLIIKPRIQPLTHVPFPLEGRLSECVPEKDVPILLGALFSKADTLITLDQKHFLKNEGLANLHLPLAIMTPGDFIKKYIL